jgi:hypothetical protein
MPQTLYLLAHSLRSMRCNTGPRAPPLLNQSRTAYGPSLIANSC